MGNCDHLNGCRFFEGRISAMPHFAEVFRSRYCESGHHETCARYRVAEHYGLGAVPVEMYPNDFEAAEALIAGPQIAQP